MRTALGLAAITGNHVILALHDGGPYVALVHLRSGSIRVHPGDRVTAGQELALCGNSGNSTQPHLHIQVMDSLDLPGARGLPMAFRAYHVWRRDSRRARQVSQGVPDNGEVVEPLPAGS